MAVDSKQEDIFRASIILSASQQLEITAHFHDCEYDDITSDEGGLKQCLFNCFICSTASRCRN